MHIDSQNISVLIYYIPYGNGKNAESAKQQCSFCYEKSLAIKKLFLMRQKKNANSKNRNPYERRELGKGNGSGIKK